MLCVIKETLTMKKFELAKDQETARFNSWFSFCKKEQIPYVIVKERSKYAMVEFDYISLEKKYEEILTENYDALMHSYDALVNKYNQSSPKLKYEFNSLLLKFDNIDKSVASGLAEDVFDIVSTMLKTKYLIK
jgi:hypothetical protein